MVNELGFEVLSTCTSDRALEKVVAALDDVAIKARLKLERVSDALAS